jgi:hypothetical protein
MILRAVKEFLRSIGKISCFSNKTYSVNKYFIIKAYS